jgi:hypothetical protein
MARRSTDAPPECTSSNTPGGRPEAWWSAPLLGRDDRAVGLLAIS